MTQVYYSVNARNGISEITDETIENGVHIPFNSLISKSKTERENVLFIEPHSDDAVYSAGGTIVSMCKNGSSVSSLCVFSKGGSNENLRHNENMLVFKTMLKSDVKFAQFVDYLYRDNKGLKSHFETFIQVRKIIDETIEITKPTKIFGPLGIGLHPDHVMINTILIDILNKRNDMSLCFYEDFPYCNETRYAYIKSLTDAKLKLKMKAKYVDITDEFEDKVSLHMVYQSQHSYKRSELSDILLKLGEAVQLEGIDGGYNTKFGRVYERFWEVIAKEP